MHIPRIVLGTLVAVGLFTLAGTDAKADHPYRGPSVYRGYRAPIYAPVYAPVYRPVYVSPYGYGVPTYGYSRSYYSAPGFGFGYSSGGYYGSPFYGRPYYGRPGVSFGFTFR